MIYEKRIILVILIVTIINLPACISKHKRFNYFKEVPFSKNKFRIRYDGIYFIKSSNESYPTGYICFYLDGSTYVPPHGVENMANLFWSNPKDYAESLEKYWNKFPNKEWWGSYKIINDSIYIQYFYKFNQTTVKRDLVELRGVITNDYTIMLVEKQCGWCQSMSPTIYNENAVKKFTPPVEYKFYPTDFKPDSSQAWFLKKRWYKKGLHESRK